MRNKERRKRKLKIERNETIRKKTFEGYAKECMYVCDEKLPKKKRKKNQTQHATQKNEWNEELEEF